MIKIPDNLFVPSDNDISGLSEDIEIEFDVETLEEDERPDLEKSGNIALVEDVVDFFSPGGALQLANEIDGRQCEFRPQQLAMGKAIAERLISGRNLVVEAPTGVGKSFAYLAPLAFRSQYASLPAVISTETINLQEQLMTKDIPILKEITGLDFKAALAKGRGNYLCLRRLKLLKAEAPEEMLPSETLIVELDRIVEWEKDSMSGERDDIGFRVDMRLWSLICCEVGSCLGAKCNSFRYCHYMRARRDWENANIIVANHALFFSDLGMRQDGAYGALLPNYGMAMIDESHTLEDNAAEYLGLRLSKAGVLGVLNRLFNPDNARGLLMRGGSRTLELRQIIAGLSDNVGDFFRPFELFLKEGGNDNDGFEAHTRRIREQGKFQDILSAPMLVLYRKLLEFVDIQEDESFKAELQAQADRCRGIIDGAKSFVDMNMNDSVYYVEQERGSIVLNASPLNVAELLNDVLFNQEFPVVLSSATLTVRNSFDFYCGRVGFDNGDTLLLDSPFDREQAELIIERDMPEPTHENYAEALADNIAEYVEQSDGRAFVLFTSYSSMRTTADKLRDFFENKNITLLVQGESMTRSDMLDTFKTDIRSVLFGTDSFWTGVDVPGEALSCVILTRLPFPSPGHPLVAARNELIELSGGNSFRDYILPSAVLKFRQGAGRLIRSRSDFGTIVVLDCRIVTKGYGRSFLNSLSYPITIN